MCDLRYKRTSELISDLIDETYSDIVFNTKPYNYAQGVVRLAKMSNPREKSNEAKKHR